MTKSSIISIRHTCHDSFYELTDYDCRNTFELFGIRFNEEITLLIQRIINNFQYGERIEVLFNRNSLTMNYIGRSGVRTIFLENDQQVHLTELLHGEIKRSSFECISDVVIEDAEDFETLTVALAKSMWG